MACLRKFNNKKGFVYLVDFRINGKKSILRAEGCAHHLRKEFSGMQAVQISTSIIKLYVANRQKDGVSNATINRELAAIKRAFNLGVRCTPSKVAQVPYIPMLKENNVRKGFIEHEDYVALKEALPDYFKPILTFGYLSGWRRSEILGLKWNQVNLRDGIVLLEPGETKNSEGRTLYMEPEIWDMMKHLHQNRRMDCLYVFHLNGNKIVDFKKSWKKASKKIGRPDLLFHDLRRSAVRNMVRAGIPERVVMTISGHKTRAVFDRYNIVSQEDLKEAALRRHNFYENQAERLHFGYILPKNAQKVTTIGS